MECYLSIHLTYVQVFLIVSLSTLRPVLLYNILLVDFTHGIAFNAVNQLEHRWDLIGCHFLLELRTQALEFQWVRLCSC